MSDSKYTAEGSEYVFSEFSDEYLGEEMMW